MTNRDRFLAIMNYQPYDRMPVLHFGYWRETLEKWAGQGHISMEMAQNWGDGNPTDAALNQLLGFDADYYSCFHPKSFLAPAFAREVIQELPDGSKHIRDGMGVTLLQAPEAGSIPAEIDHLLKDRAAWEEHYKWRLQWDPQRVNGSKVLVNGTYQGFDAGGLDFLKADNRDYHMGIACGSGIGTIRNTLGVVGLSYMQVDDESLLAEIIDTSNQIAYQCVEFSLQQGAVFDFGHFWEDICFKNGPLVSPTFFKQRIQPWYQKFSALLTSYGIDLISVDCDGMIDELVPLWLESGVNVMFPIEVGTWNASLAPWRQKYGRGLRGIGGMNKTVFSRNRAAVDAEIERLRAVIDLGGFIPCPDHRIAPDAEWDLVKYYTDKMHAL